MEEVKLRTVQKLVNGGWVGLGTEFDLVVGDVFRAMEDDGTPVPGSSNAVAFKVIAEPTEAGVDCVPVIVAKDGTVLEMEQPPKEVPVEICEGCRYLQYTRIPKWTCKLLKRCTPPEKYFQGYPKRECEGSYRR